MTTFKNMIDEAPTYNDAIARYINYGIETGGFLKEVLSNRLTGSYARADSHNLIIMKDWATWMYQYGHPMCCGSVDIVQEWVRDGGLKGIQRVTFQGTRVDDKISVTVQNGCRNVAVELENQAEDRSPEGFNWGYLGSGPTALAISILSFLSDDDPPPEVVNAFKSRYVAVWPDAWEITSIEVNTWLEGVIISGKA